MLFPAMPIALTEDIPTALWFSYVFAHNASAPVIVQRVKLAGSENARKIEMIAHVTNHIFAQGYVEPKYRSVVHWETACGKKVGECVRVEEVLSWGEGVCEEKPLRLVIGKWCFHCFS